MLADLILGTAELTFELTDAGRVFSLLSILEIPFNHSEICGNSAKLRIPLYKLTDISEIRDIVKVRIFGLPRLLYLYRKRWGIAAGVLIFSLIVYISGTVIWSIDVTGNSSVSDQYITETLEIAGCSVGTRIKGLDFDDINNRFLIESDGIAWISVNMDGTHANVEVREISEGYKNTDGTVYNLIASEDGQIERMAAIEGKPVVLIGDIVKKGDLLVSGVIAYNENLLRFESGKGSVFARVSRSFDVEVPFEHTVKKYTGRECVDKSVIFFKNNINLFTNYGIPYALYDTIVSESCADFFGTSLPLKFHNVCRREYKTVTEKYTQDEAMNRLMSLYRLKLAETIGTSQMLTKEVTTEITDNAARLHCELYCLADIAEKREIKIN